EIAAEVPEVVLTRKALSRKLQRVVRCLSRDSNVVRMRFAQTCRGDANELGLRAQLIDVRASYISHSTAQTADHLEEHVTRRTLVWDASLDPFRHQFPGGHLAFLEISVGATVLHRGEATHAANHLEAAALQQQRFSRTLLRTGEHRAHHHARRASRERFHDVARVFDPAVCNHRHVAGAFDSVEDRGELRDTNAGDDARRADGSRTNTYFYCVDSAL